MTRALGIALLLALGSLPAAEPAVDELSQAGVQAAFRALQRDYIRQEDLNFDRLNRAALQGLLQRLDFGAEIVADQAAPSLPEPKLQREMLSEGIGYLRPITLSEAEVKLTRDALVAMREEGLKALVLDLRSVAAPGEFATAQAFAELFLPNATLLFKLRQLGRPAEEQTFITSAAPVWDGPLAVLVDAESNNVAEAIACTLRYHKRGIVVGSTTRGATVRYGSVPLQEGWRLRYAQAEMLLPNDSSVYRKGLVPDLRVAQEAAAKAACFARSMRGKVKAIVFEPRLQRYNETAYIAGTNPDLDAYLRRAKGESEAPAAESTDRVLQRAVDMFSASATLAKSALDWKRKPSAPEPNIPKAIPIEEDKPR